jgi:D-glycero-D-manno-heptose 1,7-bisphosphate phosphatase
MGEHEVSAKQARKAVFLDRDGVLDALVLNKATNEYEAPHSVGELKLLPMVIPGLKRLQAAGYELFLVSNQPDYAKGKSTLAELKLVHSRFDRLMKDHGVHFRQYYYCFHHPQGVVPRYSYECECRKPKPFFLIKAGEAYGLNLAASWMVGDTDKDVGCGKDAGVNTILVGYKLSVKQRVDSVPDYRAKNLNEAVDIIIKHSKTGG